MAIEIAMRNSVVTSSIAGKTAKSSTRLMYMAVTMIRMLMSRFNPTKKSMITGLSGMMMSTSTTQSRPASQISLYWPALCKRLSSPP